MSLQGKMYYSDDEDSGFDDFELVDDLELAINSYKNICIQRLLVDRTYEYNIYDLAKIVKYFGFNKFHIDCIYQAVKDNDIFVEFESFNYVESKKLLKRLHKVI